MFVKLFWFDFFFQHFRLGLMIYSPWRLADTSDIEIGHIYIYICLYRPRIGCMYIYMYVSINIELYSWLPGIIGCSCYRFINIHTCT